MRRILLSTFVVLGLLGCQEKPKPAPKPAPVKTEAPADPAALEKARIEAAQKRVTEVLEELKTKHPDLAALEPIINEIPLVSPAPAAAPGAPAVQAPQVAKEYLYEIISSRGIVYTNKDVDYIFMGSLLLGSGQNVQNMTSRQAAQDLLAKQQQAQADVSGSDVFQSIWLQDGLSFKYGTGENRVIVFEDPDCPSCQRLHHNFEAFGAKLNLDVKVIPFVLTNKHPEGVMHAKAIFCAPDPAATWKAWMLEASGKDVATAWPAFAQKNNLTVTNCERAAFVDSWQDVGKQLGLSATPSIMFTSGMMGEGSMDEEAFIEALAMVRQAQAAAQAAPAVPAPAPQAVQPAQPVATPAPAPAPVVQTTTTVTTPPAPAPVPAK